MKTAITGHMLVKNEDRWVWFAIQSILPYVDVLLITDTGSADHTLKCIESIKSSKIKLTRAVASSASDITKLRQAQLDETHTPWLWLIDGDEIYPAETAEEIVSYTRGKTAGIVVRRYDLLGDIYHRQSEGVGSYSLLGQTGHLVTRLIHIPSFPGLHLERSYPLEAYVDGSGKEVNQQLQSKWSITHNYLYHAMYLSRSSSGNILKSTLNRSKYKIEKGIPVTANPPAVFTFPRPSFVPDPLARRTFSYELAASLLTPIKKIKRRIL